MVEGWRFCQPNALDTSGIKPQSCNLCFVHAPTSNGCVSLAGSGVFFDENIIFGFVWCLRLACSVWFMTFSLFRVIMLLQARDLHCWQLASPDCWVYSAVNLILSPIAHVKVTGVGSSKWECYLYADVSLPPEDHVFARVIWLLTKCRINIAMICSTQCIITTFRWATLGMGA